MMKSKVFFVVPFLKRHDATGDYLLSQFELFKSKGHKVYVCANEFHENVGMDVYSYDFLFKESDNNSIIIYHYGIFDAGYETVCQTKAEFKIFYYHNQTPPIYFKKFDEGTAHALEKGLAQISNANVHFDKFIANSQYTIDQQSSRLVLDDVEWTWLPPMICSKDLYLGSRFTVLNNRKYTFCHLGRIVPHKNIEHALYVFKSFQRYHPSARMVVIGTGAGRYYDFIKNLVETTVGVELYEEVSDEERSLLLSNSKLLLNLSEHEGFSLPIFEAVSAGCLPIYGRSSWLHSMINVNSLRVCLDGDFDYAAFRCDQILKYNTESHFQETHENLSRFIPFMDENYQYRILSAL